MASNLAIDDNLLREAQTLSGLKTKKDTVNFVLKEFITRYKQLEVIDLFGKIDFDEDYNYKSLRNR